LGLPRTGEPGLDLESDRACRELVKELGVGGGYLVERRRWGASEKLDGRVA
jgi:hypothetical protein